MERINPNPRFYNTSPQQKVAKKSWYIIVMARLQISHKQRVVIWPILFIVMGAWLNSTTGLQGQ